MQIHISAWSAEYAVATTSKYTAERAAKASSSSAPTYLLQEGPAWVKWEVSAGLVSHAGMISKTSPARPPRHDSGAARVSSRHPCRVPAPMRLWMICRLDTLSISVSLAAARYDRPRPTMQTNCQVWRSLLGPLGPSIECCVRPSVRNPTLRTTNARWTRYWTCQHLSPLACVGAFFFVFFFSGLTRRSPPPSDPVSKHACRRCATAQSGAKGILSTVPARYPTKRESPGRGAVKNSDQRAYCPPPPLLHPA